MVGGSAPATKTDANASRRSSEAQGAVMVIADSSWVKRKIWYTRRAVAGERVTAGGRGDPFREAGRGPAAGLCTGVVDPGWNVVWALHSPNRNPFRPGH